MVHHRQLEHPGSDGKGRLQLFDEGTIRFGCPTHVGDVGGRRGRRQLVEELSPPACQIIEFVFTPDRTSINNLKVALLELNDGGRIKERNR